MNNGRFQAEIIPVPLPQRRGDPILVETDEHPRIRRGENGYELETDMAQLAKLRPAFRAGGAVTAGNSSGLNDGAAALVLMSREKAEALGIKPLARWLSSA
ncbi:hypothetical protein V6O07_09570, partial [Arthrospira platensis SPKY2]